MVVLDATIANIALPFIGADLDITQANLSWIVTGYALAFGGLLLLGGRLGDLYGRRRIFMIGLIDLRRRLAARRPRPRTRPCCSASRGLQGLGAALASPAALALITTTFPAGPARNRAFAVYAAMSGAGAAVGLILGGWLTGLDSFLGIDLDGWRLTFLINVPIGLSRPLLAPRVPAPSPSRQHRRLDVPGAITGTLGLLGLVYGLTRAGEAATAGTTRGPSPPSSPASPCSPPSSSSSPAPSTRCCRSGSSPTAPGPPSFVAMMLVPAAMFAMFFFLCLFIQHVDGLQPAARPASRSCRSRSAS